MGVYFRFASANKRDKQPDDGCSDALYNLLHYGWAHLRSEPYGLVKAKRIKDVSSFYWKTFRKCGLGLCLVKVKAGSIQTKPHQKPFR